MTKLLNQYVIARQLGLAPATVSRALHEKPGINPETRDRVHKLALKLGYTIRPRNKTKNNSAAHYLGVLVQTPKSHWAQFRYLISLSDVASQLNASLIVHYVGFGECANVLIPERQPSAMRDGRIKGVCLIHRWPYEVVEELSKRFACISIMHTYPGLHVDVVELDHRGAMEQLVRHLYYFGHRQIGFLGYCRDLAWSSARFAGYVEMQMKLGLPYKPQWVIPVPAEAFEEKSMPESITNEVIRLVRQEGVRAWMAANDWSGNALVNALLKAGLRVPQDVSVTGFDNSEVGPPLPLTLTSIGMSLAMISTATIQRLRHRLANPDEPRQTLQFSCDLAIGGSTGPVQSSS
jgi:LacI family transcriptional regulator